MESNHRFGLVGPPGPGVIRSIRVPKPSVFQEPFRATLRVGPRRPGAPDRAASGFARYGELDEPAALFLTAALRLPAQSPSNAGTRARWANGPGTGPGA